MGGSTFPKLMEIGGSENGEGCLEMRGLPYYTEVFLEIPHDAAWKKNLDVFIFPLF